MRKAVMTVLIRHPISFKTGSSEVEEKTVIIVQKYVFLPRLWEKWTHTPHLSRLAVITWQSYLST